MCTALSKEIPPCPPLVPVPPSALSTDAWAILLAAALGLLIRFGLLRTIAW
ncbi:MAG: hypothetical protein WDN23_19210 [Edaphobacter sp.]